MKTVAVYGSAIMKPGESEYFDAYNLGKALGEAGFTVMTGGYSGVMEAASRGAAEAGSQVIGVTSMAIENYRPGGANGWVSTEVRHDTLRDRLMHLILNADAYVVMPGGLGTFAELVMVWELMRVRELPQRPLVCYGPYWEMILAPLRESRYVPDYAWDLVAYANDPQEVINLLNTID